MLLMAGMAAELAACVLMTEMSQVTDVPPAGALVDIARTAGASSAVMTVVFIVHSAFLTFCSYQQTRCVT